MMVERYSSAAGLSLLVTAGLFTLMQALVGDPTVDLSEAPRFRPIPPLSVEKEVDIQRRDRTAEKPPETTPPPQIELKKQSFKPNGSAISVSALNPGFDIALDNTGTGGYTDGDYLPIFKVPPEYPRRPAERGIEGYVTLEFTVTAQGTVENIRVVEAEPKGYFERAAIRAAEKFRYKPKVVNGTPIATDGVRNKISFNLAE